jgi:hypothetical protein|nr:MAG TPA: hypothetical protein [Caudoviricetes sp.]
MLAIAIIMITAVLIVFIILVVLTDKITKKDISDKDKKKYQLMFGGLWVILMILTVVTVIISPIQK